MAHATIIIFIECSLLETRRATRGAFASPEIFKTLHSNFDICRIFQRIKMKFYIYHFLEILLEFFFVLLVNYLLSRFILR